jgi:hypothetical protein
MNSLQLTSMKAYRRQLEKERKQHTPPQFISSRIDYDHQRSINSESDEQPTKKNRPMVEISDPFIQHPPEFQPISVDMPPVYTRTLYNNPPDTPKPSASNMVRMHSTGIDNETIECMKRTQLNLIHENLNQRLQLVAMAERIKLLEETVRLLGRKLY